MKNKHGAINKQFLPLVGIFLLLAFAFGWFQTGNMGTGQVESDSLFYSDKNSYYEYILKVDYTQPERDEFGSWDEYTMPLNQVQFSELLGRAPALPDDAQLDVYFPVTYLDWQLSASPNDNVLKAGMGTIQITEKENNAECKLTNDRIYPLQCRGDIVYSFDKTAGAIQRNDLTLKVQISKTTLETIEDANDNNDAVSSEDDTTETAMASSSSTSSNLGLIDRFNLWVDSIINKIMSYFK